MIRVPLTQDLVLVGGGHAHALVLRSWGMKPLPGARLTVINPGPTAPYTGMLPGHVAGHYTRDELDIDLVRLCRFAGARLILDHAIGVDQSTGQLHLAGRAPLSYDIASFDIGITSQMRIPGFAEHGVGAKPLDRYAQVWRDFLARAAAGEVAPEVAVIGGGVAGCELAMAMAHALRAAGCAPKVTVLEAAPELTGMGDATRRRVADAMKGLGIDARTGVTVTEVCRDHVRLEDGSQIPAQLCIGAAGASPHAWLQETSLPLEQGFIKVDRDFGVQDDRQLFAVGDCAVMPQAPRPKAGVFAVRAAPVLYRNLRAALGAGARRPWQPQKDFLKLISLGGQAAVGEKFGVAAGGAWLWRWKDRIDQAFMRRLSDLPTMRQPAVPAVAARGVREKMRGKPLCGGCGSKVGAAILADVLDRATDGDVLTGIGDDAAVLARPGGDYQVMSTDHLRAMIEDPALMARIAAVHALGDIWAMGAAPQVALASIILPEMSEKLQARTLAEINPALRAVVEAAGAQLVGGHTTMGAELTIGLTVTGLRNQMPLTQAGAQAGDCLVLTRPIGSGVLLAADMAGRARGRDLAAALEVMATPQDVEAGVLAPVATAMTDVTGFGLAGHVAAICQASGVAATLWPEATPVYGGARELAVAGVSSSLKPANEAAVPGLDDPLFYDPQTAGGLLAAVPRDRVAEVTEALQSAGRFGHVVGHLRPVVADQPTVTLGPVDASVFQPHG